MNKNKYCVLWLCVLVVATVIFFIFRSCSFSLMVITSGFDTESISFIEYRSLDYDKETTVFAAMTKDGEIALVRAEKNILGFWGIIDIDTTNRSQNEYHIGTGWTHNPRIGFFSTVDLPESRREYHFAFCGNDALGTVEILPHQIPNNFAINIQQRDEYYIVHVIAYTTTEDLANFSVWEILKENGCIS